MNNDDINKVVLIGAGNVGLSYCYALLNQKTKVDELAIIDLDEDRVVGEVMDLNHGLPFGPSKINIKKGTYSDCMDADLIVICAGANQEVGETRMDLIEKNNKIFKTIVNKVMDYNFEGIFLVATNPVDIMTYVTYKHSGFKPNRVLGSGTTLDTARLRYLLSEELKINSKNVHGYVIGEHGDTEFVPWSITTVGMEKIKEYISEERLDEIAVDVKEAAYEVIKRKGATFYGIGMCLVRITNAILGDENSILSVSSYDKEKDLYYGMPSVVNKDGVRNRMKLNLTLNETEKLDKSLKALSEAKESIGE